MTTAETNEIAENLLRTATSPDSAGPVIAEDSQQKDQESEIPEEIAPPPVFSTEYYLETNEDVRNSGVDPFRHYIQFGERENRRPNPVFDPEFYRKELERMDVDTRNIKSFLLHFVERGCIHNVQPNPYFAPAAMRPECNETNSLEYYLTAGRSKSPLPAVDTTYLARAGWNPEKELAVTWIEETVKAGDSLGQLNRIFDPEFYVRHYKDVKKADVDPGVHFLCSGLDEGRLPNCFFSAEYVRASHPESHFCHQSAPSFYFEHRIASRPKVIFASHDASRTGAPLIILRLLEYISKNFEVECITILDRGGDLLDDFREVSHVHVLTQSIFDVAEDSDEHREEIRNIISHLGDAPVSGAFVNSAESRHIAAILSQSNIKVIFLWHEIPSFYPTDVLTDVDGSSSLLVFPSHYIEKDFLKNLPELRAPRTVRGQGMIQARNEWPTRERARKSLFSEFLLDPESFVIIGCGTIDLRKGVDLFVQAACSFINRHKQSRNVVFLWFGTGDTSPGSIGWWSTLFAKKDGYDAAIRLVGPREEMAEYFSAADLFLLTSRADPFPCVVHEAMYASVPVIAFEDTGGAPELIEGDSGTIVPCLDFDAMADAIGKYYNDEDLRKSHGAAGAAKIRKHWDFRDYGEDLAGKGEEIFHSEMPHLAIEKAVRPVYFSNYEWSLSGVNSLTEHLIDALQKRGFSPKVLLTRGRKSYVPFPVTGNSIDPANVRALQPRTDHSSAWGVWSALKRFFHNESHCVFIPNFDYLASAVTPTLPDHVGVLGVAHADDIEHYEHIYRLGRYWNRIVSVSKTIEKRILEDNLSFASKLSTIYNGVPEIPTSSLDAKFVEPETPTPIRLVYVGRFEVFQKKIFSYVRLCEELHKRAIPFELTMCGTGTEFDPIRNKLSSHIAGGRVVLTGRIPRSEVYSYLDQSDVLLLLSDFEGMSVSLLEAMNHGCVPLAWDLESGVTEILESGKDSILVSKGDFDSLCSELNRLQKNPGQRIKLAKGAKRTLQKKKLTADQMAEEYASLLDQIFDEIESGRYHRPESHFSRAESGGIIPPPTFE